MFEKIRDIISEQFNIPKDDVTLETSFYDDLSADSLDLFQIITEIEDVFGIEFSNDDAEKIKTVGDAVKYIENKSENDG